MNTTVTARESVQGIIDFLAANTAGATETEQRALAAYQTDPEATIARGVAVLEQPTTETVESTGTVETRVLFPTVQRRFTIGERQGYWTNGETTTWTRRIGGRAYSFHANSDVIRVSTMWNGCESNEHHRIAR